MNTCFRKTRETHGQRPIGTGRHPKGLRWFDTSVVSPHLTYTGVRVSAFLDRGCRGQQSPGLIN